MMLRCSLFYDKTFQVDIERRDELLMVGRAATIARNTRQVMKPLFQKILPARIENIPALSGPVLRCARRLGVEEDKLKKLELALEEIMVNIVKYAYPEKDAAGDIGVACGPTTASDRPVFVVEITDTGPPFDVSGDAPQPDLEADMDDRKIGGLGIFLVKKTMDKVTCRRINNKNILTMGVYF
jgi:anti-sigma regulatory factor (Ser/Thr protein kinase)